MYVLDHKRRQSHLPTSPNNNKKDKAMKVMKLKTQRGKTPENTKTKPHPQDRGTPAAKPPPPCQKGSKPNTQPAAMRLSFPSGNATASPEDVVKAALVDNNWTGEILRLITLPSLATLLRVFDSRGWVTGHAMSLLKQVLYTTCRFMEKSDILVGCKASQGKLYCALLRENTGQAKSSYDLNLFVVELNQYDVAIWENPIRLSLSGPSGPHSLTMAQTVLDEVIITAIRWIDFIDTHGWNHRLYVMLGGDSGEDTSQLTGNTLCSENSEESGGEFFDPSRMEGLHHLSD